MNLLLVGLIVAIIIIQPSSLLIQIAANIPTIQPAFGQLPIEQQQQQAGTTPKSITSVKSYGAVPDDGKDDTSAFRRAVRAASLTPTELFVPAGTYNLRDVIRLPTDITIVGEGKDKTIIDWSIKDTAIDVFRAVANQTNPLKNIVIKDLWINGTGVNTMGNCIAMIGVTGFTIEDTRLSSCGGDPNGGAVLTKNALNGVIINNVMEKSRNGYITPSFRDNATASGGSNNMLIAYNVITNSEDDAIHPENGYGNRIIGNIAIDSGDDNIDIFREDHTIIENNTIIMSAPSIHVNGFELGDGSTNTLLKGNRVIGGSAYGINIATDLGFAAQKSGDFQLINKNLTIVNNEVDGSVLGCLRSFYADNVIIANNTFHRCNTVAVIGASNIPTSDHGYVVQAGEGGYGMLFADNSTNIKVTNNLIEYIGGKKTSSGIYFRDGAFISVDGNQIQLSRDDSVWQGDAIFIREGIDNISIANNNMTRCGCNIEVASAKPNIHITVFEPTTTIQSIRLPFEFPVIILDSGGQNSTGGSDNSTAIVSGESIIRVKSIQADISKHRLLIDLDRSSASMRLGGSMDFKIPRQIIDSVLNVAAFSDKPTPLDFPVGANYTAGDNNSTYSAYGSLSDIQQGGIVFAEHQKNQTLPFQELSRDPSFIEIRVLVSDTVNRVEIDGVGQKAPGLSLTGLQAALFGGVIAIVGGIGSSILFLKKKDKEKETSFRVTAGAATALSVTGEMSKKEQQQQQPPQQPRSNNDNKNIAKDTVADDPKQLQQQQQSSRDKQMDVKNNDAKVSSKNDSQ